LASEFHYRHMMFWSKLGLRIEFADFVNSAYNFLVHGIADCNINRYVYLSDIIDHIRPQHEFIANDKSIHIIRFENFAEELNVFLESFQVTNFLNKLNVFP